MQGPSFTIGKIGKTLIFNPVVWVRVRLYTNDTCLFCGPLCSLPGHIFRFFVSYTGPEEIVPVGTRGNGGIIMEKKKTGKKKKSGNLIKRAQKKFERDPRKKIFCERNPRLCESQKLRAKFAI